MQHHVLVCYDQTFLHRGHSNHSVFYYFSSKENRQANQNSNFDINLLPTTCTKHTLNYINLKVTEIILNESPVDWSGHFIRTSGDLKPGVPALGAFWLLLKSSTRHSQSPKHEVSVHEHVFKNSSIGI